MRTDIVILICTVFFFFCSIVRENNRHTETLKSYNIFFDAILNVAQGKKLSIRKDENGTIFIGFP